MRMYYFVNEMDPPTTNPLNSPLMQPSNYAGESAWPVWVVEADANVESHISFPKAGLSFQRI